MIADKDPAYEPRTHVADTINLTVEGTSTAAVPEPDDGFHVNEPSLNDYSLEAFGRDDTGVTSLIVSVNRNKDRDIIPTSPVGDGVVELSDSDIVNNAADTVLEVTDDEIDDGSDIVLPDLTVGDVDSVANIVADDLDISGITPVDDNSGADLSNDSECDCPVERTTVPRSASPEVRESRISSPASRSSRPEGRHPCILLSRARSPRTEGRERLSSPVAPQKAKEKPYVVEYDDELLKRFNLKPLSIMLSKNSMTEYHKQQEKLDFLYYFKVVERNSVKSKSAAQDGEKPAVMRRQRNKLCAARRQRRSSLTLVSAKKIRQKKKGVAFRVGRRPVQRLMPPRGFPDMISVIKRRREKKIVPN